jgi:hypothetical protein
MRLTEINAKMLSIVIDTVMQYKDDILRYRIWFDPLTDTRTDDELYSAEAIEVENTKSIFDFGTAVGKELRGENSRMRSEFLTTLLNEIHTALKIRGLKINYRGVKKIK